MINWSLEMIASNEVIAECYIDHLVGYRDEPNMLKYLRIILSRTSQKFYPIFL